ncbi:MAG: hypothetical protein F6K31_06120, partial [Symploca sp. SIO2G7]|nr:hypothetical protein [Symploca sp. SIO2G7]
DKEPDNGKTPAKSKVQGSEKDGKSSTPASTKKRLQEPSSKEQEKLAGEFNL